MKKPPAKFRRLTRSEAKARGVSYSAKHQVDARLKRVTKATKTYTNRQAAQLRTGKKKEAYTKSRQEIRNLKSGGIVLEFKKLDKQNLLKKLRKYKDHPVLLKFGGNDIGKRSEYKGRDISTEEWFSGIERIEARQLLNPDNLADYMDESGVEGHVTFGLLVYPRHS